MERVAEEVYEALLEQGISDSIAFDSALNAARNVSEKFSEVYKAERSGECCDDEEAAWDRANEAAWDDIFDAALLAVIGRGFVLAEAEGLTDKEYKKLDARVGQYVDSVLGK